ncbi:MAG: ATP-binding protein [Ruminococcus sp.]|nr:ATP-binding protein [Ruminococcus sp.]
MDNEIFDKAHAIISKRRIAAVSENERRIAEVNEKIPQIREVNSQIYNTGRELIKIMSSKDKSLVERKIAQLEKFNLGAQAMTRQLLVQNGYPENYLDMEYTCPKCQDTGYCNNEFCECFKKVCGSLAVSRLNQNSQLKLSSFDTFDLTYYKNDDYFTMHRIFLYTKNYAESFTESSESILMFGKTGLGKTHLSLAIANKVLERGYSVVYDSIINILRSIEREHFSREHSTDFFDLIMDTDLLILDDLGTEYESTFYSSTIYNIINTRLNRSKPTIISTNLNHDDIRRRYDERLVSRITAVYTCLEFKGKDVRLQSKKNEVLK